MKLQIKDVVSYLGIDYLVEGIIRYRLAGRKLLLARLVDGRRELWMAPPANDLDERVVFFEACQIDLATPPPANIYYKGQSYLPAFSGEAEVATSGRTPGRVSGTCPIWRYRAAGDLFIQIESWPDGLVVLAGPSAHQGMLQILPAK